MAEFCKQCALEHFGPGDEFNDAKSTFAWAAEQAGVQPVADYVMDFLCEGCGFTQVDREGESIHTRERQVRRMYRKNEEHAESVERAIAWATRVLTDKEGTGHEFHITGTPDGRTVCSFAKPEWPGDHCGKPMDTGAQAIVRAVCEYLCES